MSSPSYQALINSVVSLPIRRGPGIFLHVSVMEHPALKNQTFDMTKFTAVTPLSLLCSWELSFPFVGFKISFSKIGIKIS
jgi:hypothetical protein